MIRQPHGNVEAPVAVHDARDDAPVRQPAELIDNGGGLHAVERRSAVVDPDFELGNLDLLLQLQINNARNRRKLPSQILARRQQRVEIIAENLERNGGANARKYVIE